MPLPNISNGTTRQCSVLTKRTGLLCRNPAAYGCTACRMHGAHRSRKVLTGKDHYRYIHGESTRQAKKRASEVSRQLHDLRELGELLQIFTGNTNIAGRRPRGR